MRGTDTDVMQRNGDTLSLCAFVLFIGINMRFLIKYASRLSAHITAISAVAYIGLLIIFRICYMRSKPYRYADTAAVVVALVYAVLSVLMLTQVDKHSLNVDRWEIIDLFWRSVARGEYPYSAVAHNGNHIGAMPVYHILCLPFHCIGEIGYATLLSIAAMLIAIYRAPQNQGNSLLFATMLIISSPAILWETLTRSTIIYNSMLFYLFMLYLRRFETFSKTQFIITAIIGGALASTRTTLALIYVIWGIYMLRQHIPFKRILAWTGICIASYVVTFLPLIIAYPSQFLEINPFTVQSGVTNNAELAAFVALMILTGFLPKNHKSLIFYIGAYLFVIIGINFVDRAAHYSLRGALMESSMDISYFLFSLPFLLHSAVLPYRHETGKTPIGQQNYN